MPTTPATAPATPRIEAAPLDLVDDEEPDEVCDDEAGDVLLPAELDEPEAAVLDEPEAALELEGLLELELPLLLPPVAASTVAGVPPDWPWAPVLSRMSNWSCLPTSAVVGVKVYGLLWMLPIVSSRPPTWPFEYELTSSVYGGEPPVQLIWIGTPTIREPVGVLMLRLDAWA